MQFGVMGKLVHRTLRLDAAGREVTDLQPGRRGSLRWQDRERSGAGRIVSVVTPGADAWEWGDMGAASGLWLNRFHLAVTTGRLTYQIGDVQAALGSCHAASSAEGGQ